MTPLILAALLLASPAAKSANSLSPKSSFKSELIFPTMQKHNHGSCIVELPNGDLLASWYRGSGERTADDVAILGSRLRKGDSVWSDSFVMADTPGFPDTNACMIIDPKKRLWLFWPTILANQWESALMKYNISSNYQRNLGAPVWESEHVMPLKPGPEFLTTVERDLEKQWSPCLAIDKYKDRITAGLANYKTKAADKLTVRLGWMTRVHPFILEGRRMIVPLYSDGFDFSIMALTDDWGETWTMSEPLVGPGNVQPTIAQRKDKTLVAYFRDNGPPPQRVMISESKDEGLTWTLVRDTELPDPGAGVDVIVLKSGKWVLVNNDTEGGRHSLALTVSEDEGAHWTHKRHLEIDPAEVPDAGSYSYPSIIQTRDGTIHVTYSYFPNRANREKEGKGESIKHAAFNETWLVESDSPQ